MKRLFSYMRRHWLTYFFGILATFLTATFYNFVPLLTRDAINAAQSGHRTALAHYAELIALVAVVMGTARWISRFVIFNIGRDIEYEMRNDLFAHLAKLGPDFYQRLRTGDLMSRMVNDITALRLLVGLGVLMLTNTPVYFVYALIFMTYLNRQLTVAAIIPAILLLFGVRRLTRSLMERSLKVQQELGNIGAKVQESLAGIHVVKAYTLEEHEAQRFRALNDVYNEQGLALARTRGGLFPMIRAAAATSTMIVLIYGGHLVVAGQMSIGDLMAFMLYVTQLAFQATSFGWVLSIYQRGKAAMKRIDEIFEDKAQQTVAGPEERLEVDGAIEWQDVSFSYFASNGNGKAAERPPYALQKCQCESHRRREARDRRPHRLRQIHHDQTAREANRADRGTRPARRSRHSRDAAIRAAQAHHRGGAARADAVLGHAGAQYRVRRADAEMKEIEVASRVAGLAGRCRGAAARLRHDRRRARDVAFGRSEAARHASRGCSLTIRRWWCSTTRYRASIPRPSAPCCTT